MIFFILYSYIVKYWYFLWHLNTWLYNSCIQLYIGLELSCGPPGIEFENTAVNAFYIFASKCIEVGAVVQLVMHIESRDIVISVVLKGTQVQIQLASCPHPISLSLLPLSCLVCIIPLIKCKTPINKHQQKQNKEKLHAMSSFSDALWLLDDLVKTSRGHSSFGIVPGMTSSIKMTMSSTAVIYPIQSLSLSRSLCTSFVSISFHLSVYSFIRHVSRSLSLLSILWRCLTPSPQLNFICPPLQ